MFCFAGEEKAPVIDLLSYVDMSSLQNKHCDQTTTKYVPFPPLRPSVPSYLPTQNRYGQLPIDGKTIYKPYLLPYGLKLCLVTLVIVSAFCRCVQNLHWSILT